MCNKTPRRPGAKWRDDESPAMTAARKEVGQAMQAGGLDGLVALRMAHGLTQAQAADKLGLAHPHLALMEDGEMSHLTAEALSNLARVYGCSLDAVRASLQSMRERHRAGA